MLNKQTRAPRLAVENLERRETPSGHVSAAALAASRAFEARGRGTADVAFSDPVVNGQHVVTLISGSARGLGKFGGRLEIYYGVNTYVGSGQGALTLANGDRMNLILNSVTRAPVSPHGPNGAIRFTVFGGTGAYSNAIGHGTITGHVNVLYNYRFTLQGRIRR